MIKFLLPLFFVVQQSFTDQNVNRYCTDLTPQNDIEVDTLMGMWFGVEVITHHDHEVGEYNYDSCIMVHLAEITHELLELEHLRRRYYDDYDMMFATTTQQPHKIRHGSDYYHNTRDRDSQYHGLQPHHKELSTRYLRLGWDEKGLVLEYILKFENNRRGFWRSVEPQRGSSNNALHYNQFTGTVQVLKAVGNHIVLTFCQNLPSSQLFTIVLSRQPNELSDDTIQSIRGMLRRRGLSVSSIRKVCRNGSSQLTVGFTTLLLFMFAHFARLS